MRRMTRPLEQRLLICSGAVWVTAVVGAACTVDTGALEVTRSDAWVTAPAAIADAGAADLDNSNPIDSAVAPDRGLAPEAGTSVPDGTVTPAEVASPDSGVLERAPTPGDADTPVPR